VPPLATDTAEFAWIVVEVLSLLLSSLLAKKKIHVGIWAFHEYKISVYKKLPYVP